MLSKLYEFVDGILALGKNNKTDDLSIQQSNLTESQIKIALFPHVHADGDAMGSCLAFSLILTKLGFLSKIFLEEDLPDNLVECLGKELVNRYVIRDEEQMRAFFLKTDYVFRLDSSEDSRLGKRIEFYKQAQAQKKALTLDHHLTNDQSIASDLLAYIDSEASSTCELVADCLKIIEKRKNERFLDKDIATTLLLGMITDTGRFSYSNVRENTFLQAAYLMQEKIPLAKIVYKLYDEKTPAYYRLRGQIYQKMLVEHEGQILIAKLAYRDFRELECKQRDTEGLSAELRNMENVVYAIFLQGLKNGTIKASIRSNEVGSAFKLAQKFGGGGHEKAAGFSLEKEDLYKIFGSNGLLVEEEIMSEQAIFVGEKYSALQEYWLENLEKEVLQAAKHLLNLEK